MVRSAPHLSKRRRGRDQSARPALEEDMKIYVRRRHIERGKRGVASACPVALAFEEITGERPMVDGYCINTHDDSFALTSMAARFIERFDAGEPVKPFAFVLK